MAIPKSAVLGFLGGIMLVQAQSIRSQRERVIRRFNQIGECAPKF